MLNCGEVSFDQGRHARVVFIDDDLVSQKRYVSACLLKTYNVWVYMGIDQFTVLGCVFSFQNSCSSTATCLDIPVLSFSYSSSLDISSLSSLISSI